MRRIADGFYEVVEGMPCTPRQLNIGRYMCPNTLGNTEVEEAAARVLFVSKDFDRWVGISWKVIVAQLVAEHEIDLEISEAISYNSSERLRVAEKRLAYCLLCVLTLGIYALFARRPMPHFVQVPTTELPFSCVPIVGPGAIVSAVQALVGKKLLRTGRNSDGEEIIFPTANLVERVMHAA